MSDNPMQPTPTIITSTQVTSAKIDADKVMTDSLTIGSAPINGVSHDDSDANLDSIPSSYLLNKINLKFQKDIETFQKRLDSQHLIPIISEAITFPYFDTDSKWSRNNFVYQYGQAIYRNDKTTVTADQGSLYLDQSVFTQSGIHFVIITIDRITGGSITVRDNTDKLIQTITAPGTYRFTVLAESASSFSLNIHVGNVPVNGIVVIDRCYIHYVADRATEYFKYVGDQVLSGDGSGLAAVSWVQQQLDDQKNALQSYSDTAALSVDNKLALHMNNKNGHNAAPSDIGAAPAVHTHTPTECGAAPTIHTHDLSGLGAASANHTHTPDQCGAAATDHTHTPDQCGASSVSHNHDIASLINAGPVVAHPSATGNVHSLVKDGIQLGNVENFPVAVAADFASRSSAKYTTPNGVGEYLDTIMSGNPTLKYIPLAPKQILKRSIDLAAGATFNLPLRTGALYDIYIDCASANANYLGMYYNEIAYATTNTNCLNSWEYGRTIDGVNHTSWSSENSDMFYLAPKDIGNNIVKGRLRIDTTLFTMAGEYQSWVGQINAGVVSLVTPTIYPLKNNGALQTLIDTSTTSTVNLVFKHNKTRNTVVSSTNIVATLIVYEMVTAANTASTNDRFAILTRTKVLGTHAPYGWAKEDGSLLTRSAYAELEANITQYGAGVTDAVYTASINSNGYCPYFVIGATTIKLPTMPCPDAGSMNIIKISMS